MAKKRKILSIVLCFVALLGALFVSSGTFSASATDQIYIGGMPTGFVLDTRGVQVVGTCNVTTNEGAFSPSKQAGVMIGDHLLYIADKEVNNVSDVQKAITDGNSVTLTIKRKNANIMIDVTPVKDVFGEYKLGLIIKNTICGIGTVTYIKGNRFGSLGHPITNENGEIANILGGSIYSCSITDVIKGEKGKAGELKGVFMREFRLGSVEKNLSSGVFGTIDTDKFSTENLIKTELASENDYKIGKAEIYSTLRGKTPEKYEIEIVKIESTKAETKNFVIKVTDKRLLELSGGIVQGMSGSPIVQNGKLIGAVTHVFLNDSTRGFGISIENMINN